MTTKEEELRWLQYGAGGRPQTRTRLSGMGWINQGDMCVSPETGESYVVTQDGWENMYDLLSSRKRAVATQLKIAYAEDEKRVGKLLELFRLSTEEKRCLDLKEVEEVMRPAKEFSKLLVLHLALLDEMDMIIVEQAKVLKILKDLKKKTVNQ
jgi:16S rRNA C1402 (ribose-2'-O) methylase RsmI